MVLNALEIDPKKIWKEIGVGFLVSSQEKKYIP
jgi:hypothetical protein